MCYFSSERATALLLTVLTTAASTTFVGCRAPDRDPLRPAELDRALALRSDPAVLRDAIALLPTEFRVQQDERDPGADMSAAHVSFWRDAARAWSQPVRRALRAWQSNVARSAGAGLPEDIALAAETDDVEDFDAAAVLRASIDVLGLLGLGASAAAEVLAGAEARAAYGSLHAAWWAARFQVERARVRLAASRARIDARRELVEDTRDDAIRLTVYEEKGWLPAATVAAARALMARASHELEVERAIERDGRESLATRAGLLSSDPHLDAVDSLVLDEYELVPDRRTLREGSAHGFENHPVLRAAKLEYAVAEARVRRAASETWPGLRIGPKQRIEPQSLLGAFVELRLPWPGRADAATLAAIEDRATARVDVEERVREIRSAVRESLERLAHRKAALRDAEQIAAASSRAFVAAQARWSVEATALGMFNDALERRLGDAVAAITAREQAILAWLAWREAAGPEQDASEAGGER